MSQRRLLGKEADLQSDWMVRDEFSHVVLYSCCFGFILSWFVTCFGYVMCWLVSGFAMVDEVNMGFVFYMLHHTVCNIDCHDSLYGSIDEPLSRTKQKRWPT